MRYDRLVIATRAKPVRPDLPGSKHEGVFLLHTMDDSFAVHRYLADRKPRAAVLVGAGYIGLEMADALTQRGLEVTLLCRADTVLPTVDPALGGLIQEGLRRHGVRVRIGVSAVEINQTEARRPSRLSIADSVGAEHGADLVILAVGARPDSELAEQGRSSALRAPLSLRGKCARTWLTYLPRAIASRPTTACLTRRPISRWERSRTNRGGSPARMRLAATGYSRAR
jgi:NAD(P)H-nitrite reductase large subunit